MGSERHAYMANLANFPEDTAIAFCLVKAPISPGPKLRTVEDLSTFRQSIPGCNKL